MATVGLSIKDYGAAKSRFRDSQIEGLRFRFLELLNGRYM